MMKSAGYRINLTDSEIDQLKQLIRKSTAPQDLVKRAKIILMANEEHQSNRTISERIGTTVANVTKWTKRWINRALEPVKERLSDLPRSGSPCRITPEQWCQIIAVACTPPAEYDRPITHWSGSELADEVIKQGIVESISKSHLNDFLKKQTYSRTALVTG